MLQLIDENKDLFDLLVQVLIVVIPILITWFIRNFVRGSVAERDMAAIVRLSNSAIDYVENLDNRGGLTLPPETSKGVHKLQLAGQWLESELKRAGVKITDEEAEKWIGAEFQKRIGNVQMTGTLAELARSAIDIVQSLERNGVLELPPGANRFTFLADLSADWLVTKYAQQGAKISREEALTWVTAELVQTFQVGGSVPSSDAQLADLANRAIIFLEQLKSSGQLKLKSGSTGANVEFDIATAWLLTEAAKQGLEVTPNQIAEAITIAFSQQQSGM
jgi:hypothetical protein